MAERDIHPTDEAQAERGRALIQAAVAQTQAPLALRERIENDRVRAKPARRRWTLGGSLAGAVAAVALAIVLASGGGSAGLSVAQAGDLARLGPAAKAPAVNPLHPGQLERSVGGVVYPSWQDQFTWKASGTRVDTVNGRRVVTVFYDNPAGERIAYSIVDGKPLDEPSGRSLRQGSERYVIVRKGARTLVTWRRGGHTCIVSAPAKVSSDKLLTLASWSGTETS